MSKKQITALIQVKTELAAKYTAKAEQTPSAPRRKSYLNKALRYRRQVARLQHLVS